MDMAIRVHAGDVARQVIFSVPGKLLPALFQIACIAFEPCQWTIRQPHRQTADIARSSRLIGIDL